MKTEILRLLIGLWLALGVNAQAERNNPNTDWFSQSKYGVFIHFLPSGQDFQKYVDSFDVDGFARDCQDAGAAYVIFTLGQDGHYCSPNATYDRFAGYTSGQKCSTRDLPMDMHVALAKKGIKLMLYINGDAPISDEQAAKGLGARERNGQVELGLQRHIGGTLGSGNRRVG
jgi:hypothetical protein